MHNDRDLIIRNLTCRLAEMIRLAAKMELGNTPDDMPRIIADAVNARYVGMTHCHTVGLSVFPDELEATK